MKDSVNEIAKEVIKSAKDVFGNKIDDIMLFNVMEAPAYRSFSVKFALYNYYVLRFNYDRGHFGCCIIFGEYSISVSSTMEWAQKSDFNEYWKEIDKQVRLRIPDKFLEANGWA